MRGLPTLLALAAAMATVSPLAGDELWRGSAAAPCDLLLINELGGVRLGTASSADSAPVVGGVSELTIETTTSDGVSTLTVVRRGAAADDAAAGNVELSVPPACSVTVRTVDGPVAVRVGPEAFPLAVETVTGDITAWMEPAADAAINLATSGEITTDYTIAIDFRYHEEPAKYGRVAIGDGSIVGAAGAPTEVHLTSRRGTVSVLRPIAGSGRPDSPR